VRIASGDSPCRGVGSQRSFHRTDQENSRYAQYTSAAERQPDCQGNSARHSALIKFAGTLKLKKNSPHHRTGRSTASGRRHNAKLPHVPLTGQQGGLITWTSSGWAVEQLKTYSRIMGIRWGRLDPKELERLLKTRSLRSDLHRYRDAAQIGKLDEMKNFLRTKSDGVYSVSAHQGCELEEILSASKFFRLQRLYSQKSMSVKFRNMVNLLMR